MKGLRFLTLGDYAFVFFGLNEEEATRCLEAREMLRPWQPAVREMLAALAPVAGEGEGEAPLSDEVGAQGVGARERSARLKRLDREVEASVRAVRWGVRVGLEQAQARGDEADAARWAAADAALFPEGLSFLSGSLAEQVGETVRLLGRARAQEVAWLQEGWRVHGQTFEEAVEQIEASNGALYGAMTAPTPPPPAAVDHVALRRQALRLLRDLLPVIERAYPASDPSAAAARAALLAPVQGRAAARLAQQAERKGADGAPAAE